MAVDSASLISIPTPDLGIFVTDVDDPEQPQLPVTFELEQNYPNPFNSTTAIVYNLPNVGAQPAPVRLTIYNLLGQVVQTLIDERQHPGKHTAYWNGADQAGNIVASGIYFYSLKVSGIDLVKSRKMILMK